MVLMPPRPADKIVENPHQKENDVTTKNIAAMLVSSLLLSGCQHAVNNAPNADAQREQLSSLIGAGRFLREQCNRSDIPADAQLTAMALKDAEKKGWSPAASLPRLPEASQAVTAQLTADATPLPEKCSALNHALAPFLNPAR